MIKVLKYSTSLTFIIFSSKQIQVAYLIQIKSKECIWVFLFLQYGHHDYYALLVLFLDYCQTDSSRVTGNTEKMSTGEINLMAEMGSFVYMYPTQGKKKAKISYR